MKILLLGTWDTKKNALELLTKLLGKNNEVFCVDISCLRINNEKNHILLSSNIRLDVQEMDRGKATKNIGIILKDNLLSIIDEYNPDIILGIGGAGGTSILMEGVMKNNILFPPFILFTTIWHKIQIGSTNIYTIIIPCLTDLDIVSSFLQSEFTKLIKVVDAYGTLFKKSKQKTNKKVYIVTTLGSLHSGVIYLKELCNNEDIIPVHANGKTIQIIRMLQHQYHIDGIILLATTEFSNFLFNGDFNPREDPFNIWDTFNVPIYFVPGGLEFLVIGSNYNINEEFVEKQYKWNTLIKLYGLNSGAAQIIYNKIKKAFIKNNFKIIIPLKSYSKLSEKGQPFENSSFISTLNSLLLSDNQLNVVYSNFDINSKEFIFELQQAIKNDSRYN